MVVKTEIPLIVSNFICAFILSYSIISCKLLHSLAISLQLKTLSPAFLLILMSISELQNVRFVEKKNSSSLSEGTS